MIITKIGKWPYRVIVLAGVFLFCITASMASQESISITLKAFEKYNLDFDSIAEPVSFEVRPINQKKGKMISGNLLINGSPLILNDMPGFLHNLTKNADTREEAAILIARFYTQRVMKDSGAFIEKRKKSNSSENLDSIYSNPCVSITNILYGGSHSQAKILATLMNAAGFRARILNISEPRVKQKWLPPQLLRSITEVYIDDKWVMIDAYNGGFFFVKDFINFEMATYKDLNVDLFEKNRPFIREAPGSWKAEEFTHSQRAAHKYFFTSPLILKNDFLHNGTAKQLPASSMALFKGEKYLFEYTLPEICLPHFIETHVLKMIAQKDLPREEPAYTWTDDCRAIFRTSSIKRDYIFSKTLEIDLLTHEMVSTGIENKKTVFKINRPLVFPISNIKLVVDPGDCMGDYVFNAAFDANGRGMIHRNGIITSGQETVFDFRQWLPVKVIKKPLSNLFFSFRVSPKLKFDSLKLLISGQWPRGIVPPIRPGVNLIEWTPLKGHDGAVELTYKFDRLYDVKKDKLVIRKITKSHEGGGLKVAWDRTETTKMYEYIVSRNPKGGVPLIPRLWDIVETEFFEIEKSLYDKIKKQNLYVSIRPIYMNDSIGEWSKVFKLN